MDWDRSKPNSETKTLNKMETIPNSNEYFRIGRFVGSMDKSVRSMPSSVTLECWEKWFVEALDALRVLHTHGLVHGCLDSNSFRIDEEKKLRIGNVTKVRKLEDPLPIEAFRPQDLVYPPEVLFRFGREEEYSFSTIYEALKEKNSMFERFPSFFPSMLVRRNFENVHNTMDTVDHRKSDIWMLANTFFNIYIDLLSKPNIHTSEFYRMYHDKFKDLLGKMLHPNPSVRPFAEVALSEWGYKWKSDEAENDAENAVSTADAVSPVLQTNDSSNSVPQKKPRLVLTGARDPSGRNKTRKNLRS